MQDVSRLGANASGTYNRTQAAASAAGIPTNFSKPGAVPVKSRRRLTLMNGISVDEIRYQSMGQELSSFAGQVAAMPHDVERLTQSLANRLVLLHHEEVENQTAAVAAYYNSPVRERWIEHRNALRARTQADSSLDLSRAKGVLDSYGKLKGARAKKAFQDMACDYGVGDHQELIRFMCAMADMLERANPAQRLFGQPPSIHATGPKKSKNLYRGT